MSHDAVRLITSAALMLAWLAWHFGLLVPLGFAGVCFLVFLINLVSLVIRDRR